MPWALIYFPNDNDDSFLTFDKNSCVVRIPITLRKKIILLEARKNKLKLRLLIAHRKNLNKRAAVA